MPDFTYEALDKVGTSSRGTISARDSAEAAIRVRQLGIYPTRIAQGKLDANNGSALQNEIDLKPPQRAVSSFGSKKISRLQILLFTREMADLLDAGLPMDRAFSVLIEQSDSPPTG